MSGVDFRPMDELRSEGTHVEMKLGDGRQVIGWLYCSHPQHPRSFWSRASDGRLGMVSPVGWRELPTVAEVAA